jgi:hypothetical protein
MYSWCMYFFHYAHRIHINVCLDGNVRWTWTKVNTSRHNSELVNGKLNKNVYLNDWTKGLLYDDETTTILCGDLVIAFVIASLKNLFPLDGLSIISGFSKVYAFSSSSQLLLIKFILFVFCVVHSTTIVLSVNALANIKYTMKGKHLEVIFMSTQKYNKWNRGIGYLHNI